MSVAITIDNVVKRFGKDTIINGLSVDVRPGEFFTLLGPSGCGKTTLLRMIIGFNSIEGGTIKIDDQIINDIPTHLRNMGMVFQNYAVFPHMSVKDNVAFGLKNRKVAKEKMNALVDEILETVKIAHLKDRMPTQLSGGQQQRVALARAIVIHPQVLLMDEPLSNLDAKLRVEMRNAIKLIQQKIGITTVYVTHDQEEALAVSDRIAIMNNGIIQQIGFYLVKAGGALIDNMAILFAIGIGVGMADDNDGTAALSALASWLMITNLLSTANVSVIRTLSETSTLAFDKIANPFIGIIAGLIGSMCYNRFKNTQLPDWLSFFSGKRCVAIVSGVVSIIASVVLLFVWPVIFGALVALGEAIVSLDAVGAGIYAFFNRLLIPFGLHHALNNVFWFDTIGLGDLTHFWAGETSADVTWSLGMYMSGFFPCMMFGIPGAALAMVHTAKPAKKKVAIGLVASAAIAAFVCGVTEPFEFGFMFLAPVLYVIYALLYGIFVTITTLVGFRAGFSFSAGATDLLFSASLPAAQKTWMIIPLGIAAFIVFYVVFRFAIVKFNLKTPGREDDDVDETTVKLANNNFTEVAKIILEGVGGKENVASIDNCITRLRLEIKDYTKVDEKKIKSAGVAGVIRPGKTSVQVIIGTKVQFVADEFKKLCK